MGGVEVSLGIVVLLRSILEMCESICVIYLGNSFSIENDMSKRIVILRLFIGNNWG